MTAAARRARLRPARVERTAAPAIAIALVLAGLSSGAPAQAAQHHAHAMTDRAAPGTQATSAPDTDTHAFHAQMDADMAAMMQAMDAAPATGNADIDFAAMMIPHHQGAIDMARLQLRDGTDPAMRRLAQEIIVTQQSEIDLMRRRLRQLQQAGASH